MIHVYFSLKQLSLKLNSVTFSLCMLYQLWEKIFVVEKVEFTLISKCAQLKLVYFSMRRIPLPSKE